MSIIETYGKELVSLLVPLITWLLNSIFRARAKLLLANPHTFTFLVQEPLYDASGKQVQPNQTVHTRSFYLRNAGRDTATNVELVFNWKPLCLNIWPPRHTEVHDESDGRHVIVFPSIAPNEVFGCELLSVNADLPALIIARSDQCVAKPIEMYPLPILPPWKRRVLVSLVFLGMGLAVYLLLLLIQFLVLKTPLS